MLLKDQTQVVKIIGREVDPKHLVSELVWGKRVYQVRNEITQSKDKTLRAFLGHTKDLDPMVYAWILGGPLMPA